MVCIIEITLISRFTVQRLLVLYMHIGFRVLDLYALELRHCWRFIRAFLCKQSVGGYLGLLLH